ncbi:protein translocase subunit SecF [Rothia sp. ZJ932]|uniref:protein translocase subunit SecF n=1 Tax=Rothia sp. ZJ932 TaxID=2810516 RepID=UPI0019684463|nr:protein translocase subunit SecF [Rothia sp. ZJ932]QRZ62456.1 protein translocase subunit SecF [Rothia sp. ZJ932]
MANKLAQFGNDLHSGQKSFGFVANRKKWAVLALLIVVAAALVPVLRGGFNLGIEFRGGSEFTVSSVQQTAPAIGENAIFTAAPEASDVRVTNIAPGTMRAQMSELTDDQTLAVASSLRDAYAVSDAEVTSSFVGPTWGADVTRQALWGLVWFVTLVMAGMALYFRTWKMAVSAIAGLIFTVVTTVGLYALIGLEITPSAIIGFLTILSYSLYDTVVVFDKIRENTARAFEGKDKTFGEQINLAINQTLVRSINTSIVGLLPVGSILFIGSLMLGAGTLKDLSLALFIGIIVGTLGTLFVAAPVYAWLRLGEKAIVEHDALVEKHRRGEITEEHNEQPVTRPEATMQRIEVNNINL